MQLRYLRLFFASKMITMANLCEKINRTHNWKMRLSFRQMVVNSYKIAWNVDRIESTEWTEWGIEIIGRNDWTKERPETEFNIFGMDVMWCDVMWGGESVFWVSKRQENGQNVRAYIPCRVNRHWCRFVRWYWWFVCHLNTVQCQNRFVD